MDNKPETILQNKIRVALCEHGGGVCLRWNSGVFLTPDGRKITVGTPGVSDLLYVGNGYIAWIEVKIHPNKPSAEQLAFISTMQALGHRAGVAYSVQDALSIAGIQ